MQHSVWLVEIITRSEAEVPGIDAVAAELITKQFSFRRIWQGKRSQYAANKVVSVVLFNFCLEISPVL